MSVIIPNGMPPAEVSGAILDGLMYHDFTVVEGMPFATLNPEKRDAYISEVCGAIGELTLTGGKPGTELWTLDSQTSPNASHIPFHTDNPYLRRPEDFVSFWNLQSSPVSGENVIIGGHQVLETLSRDPQHEQLFNDLTTVPVRYTHGGEHAVSPILNPATGEVRYDQKYIELYNAKLGSRFAAVLTDPKIPSDTVKLQPGQALFFANNDVVHARKPYNDPNRHSIRVRMNLRRQHQG